jgi:uncharacterized membrane protein YeiH
VIDETALLLVLDLTGTFAFALNGAMTALRAVRLDLVGVVTLGMITALGGGLVRDLVLDAGPPATFLDWRYLAVAATGGLLAFGLSHRLGRLAGPITVLDAVGLSLFAVTGASKAMESGMGAGAAVILGTVTAVGGGTLRDMMIAQVPAVLRTGLYAVPALVAAALTVTAMAVGVYGLEAACVAAATCFTIRMLGLRYGLGAPLPPARGQHVGTGPARTGPCDCG